MAPSVDGVSEGWCLSAGAKATLPWEALRPHFLLLPPTDPTHRVRWTEATPQMLLIFLESSL